MSGEIFWKVLGLIFLVSAASHADELDGLITLAYSNSPTLQAAREGTRQAEAAHDATAEFFDPHTTATAGRMSGNNTPPILPAPLGLPGADTYGASAAVEVPFRPGIYAGVGVAEQYQANPANGLNSGYRTVVGAQIRIPLLQDRGFSLWKQNQSRLKELKVAAEAHQMEARQAVRHAVEQAYFAYLVEIANAATSWSATDRSEQLLKEAEELVRLKVVPEYQLAPARLELALRREEICTANQAIDTARLRLIQVIGTTPTTLLTTNYAALTDQAAGLQLPETLPSIPSFTTRGAMREIDALAEAAAAESRSLDDQLRPDLGLSLSSTWATEDATSPTSDGGLTGGEESSTAAVLVWTRPWSQTGAHARLRESQAREAQLAEFRRELQNQLTADLSAAHREFSGARERFKQITIAVDQARKTLDAEAERFRLGEGRSRNVLDAQNDLTKAYRSRNAIVASLLHGYSDFMFAAGYQIDQVQATEVPTPGGKPNGHQ